MFGSQLATARVMALMLTLWTLGSGIAVARVVEVKAPVPGGPSATELIQAGMNEVRSIRQATPNETVTLRLSSGVYRLQMPIIIEPRDSGRPNAPFVIEGAADGSTRLYGSVEAEARPAGPADLTGLTAPPQPVQVVDLTASRGTQPLGLVARGAYNGTPTSQFEIFQGDTRFRPSVWPRSGYADGVEARADPTSLGVRVKLPRPTFERFRSQKDLQVAGYWVADWAYEAQSMLSADPDSGELLVSRLVAPLPTRRVIRARVFNAMSELDAPGRYVLDPTGRRVFVVPVPGATAKFDVAVARELMVLATVQNVILRSIGFERTLGTPIRIENASNIVVENCMVRNSGNRGITATGGRNVVIRSSVVADTAETGILIAGGDRKNLTPARHAVTDSIFVRFSQDSPTYRPAVEIQGVGNSVTGSLFRDGPHSAILVNGNEHRVSGNEISDVVKETNDAGAIYMGRDFTARGNVFNGNYLHDIGGGQRGGHRALIGIYLDDQFSGATITGNVFHRVNVAVQIGGGRDNIVEGNAFLASQRSAVLFDDRGLHKHRAMTLTGDLNNKLNAMPFRQPLWASRYPTLATLPENQIGAPLDNVVKRNVLLGQTMIEYEFQSSRPFLSATDTIEVSVPAGIGPDTTTADLLKALAAANPAVAALGLAVADRAAALRDLTFAPAAANQQGPK